MLVKVHFNSKLLIILMTDKSNDGIAGCLSYIMPNGETLPIGFIFRTFMSVTEKRHSMTDKEPWFN